MAAHGEGDPNRQHVRDGCGDTVGRSADRTALRRGVVGLPMVGALPLAALPSVCQAQAGGRAPVEDFMRTRSPGDLCGTDHHHLCHGLGGRPLETATGGYGYSFTWRRHGPRVRERAARW